MRRVEGQRATRAHALMHTHAPPHACAPTQPWPECGALAHLGAPRRLLAGPVLREQAQQPCITVLVTGYAPLQTVLEEIRLSYSGNQHGAVKRLDARMLSHSVLANSSRPHGLTVPHQTPPSMEFSRQEYWSRLPFPTPRDLPHPGI